MSLKKNKLPQVGRNNNSESHPDSSGCPTDSEGGNLTIKETFAVGNQAAALLQATGREGTKKGGAGEENIFLSSNILRRTPPLSRQKPPQRKEKETTRTQPEKEKSEREICALVVTTPLKRPQIARARREEADLLHKCKRILSKMKVATLKQKNISNDIKFGLTELEDVIDAIAHGRDSCNCERNEEKINKPERQETPSVDADKATSSGTKKRIASSPEDQNEGKRLKEGTSPNEWMQQESKQSKRKRQRKEKEAEKRQHFDGSNSCAKSKEIQEIHWKKGRKTRPEALLIKPVDGQTYADVVKELRDKIKPDESEAEVRAIRQTRAGDVLLELGPKTKNRDSFQEILSNTLGEKVKVVSLGTRMTLEIRDLDCITDKTEVKAALERDIPGATDISINVFPTAREQKLAVIVLNNSSAMKLIEQGKIKIGWTYCRIRQRAIVRRCFKCFGYGHVARNCKGTDRSKQCYKCLGEDHQAKMCTAKERCILCTDRGMEPDKVDHTPGTGKCMVYREALQAAKNKL